MGKIKGVIQFTGKLGQVVGYKGRNSKRYIRERVAEVNNPRSMGQNIQRMILTTAAVGVSKLKTILSNSFEGKQYGADSLAYARQLWMRQLRTSDILSNSLNYLKKGEQRFAINPYQISRGSLNAPAIGFITGEENNFSILGSNFALDSNGTASQCFPSVPIGRQFTIIVVADKGAPQVAFCRFAFKSDSTPAFVLIGEHYFLNSAALDLAKCEGAWDKLQFQDAPPTASGNPIAVDASDMLFAEGNDDFDMTAAAALIISDKDGGLRSTSSLVVNPLYTANVYPAAVAAPTFGNVATEVNVASDVYLNNSTTEEQTAASVSPELPSSVETSTTKDFSVSLPTSGAIQYGAIIYDFDGTDYTLGLSSSGASADNNGIACAITSEGNEHTLSVESDGPNTITIKSINVVVDGVLYSV